MNEMYDQLTLHGYKRLKERRGTKGMNASNEIKRVLEKGKDIGECPRYVQRYLRNVLEASQGDMIKVWGNNVYLFGNGLLITTFAIPPQVIRSATKRPKFYSNDEEETDEYYDENNF